MARRASDPAVWGLYAACYWTANPFGAGKFARVSFDVSAGAYLRFMGQYSEPLAPRFADLAGIGDGQRVLDVGCGPFISWLLPETVTASGNCIPLRRRRRFVSREEFTAMSRNASGVDLDAFRTDQDLAAEHEATDPYEQ